MKARGFQIDDELQLTPCAPESAAEASGSADARTWLDLQVAESGELAVWLDRLGVRDLVRQLLLEARDRSGLYPLKREILLVIPVLSDMESGLAVDHLALLCRENLLLTMHRGVFLTTERLAEIQESETWLPERSIAALVAAVMIDESLVCLRHTAALRGSILALEERMDRDPDTVEAEEILDLRSRLLALGAVVSDQVPCVQGLNATDKPFFQLKGARDYMHCAETNLRAAAGSLSRLGQRIGDLRSGFQMHAQDKTNRRLGMLTILSAIFMPITLLAGIWGMNFETMPELKYSFSYPIALGIMAVIGSGMYLFFRRTGWFD